jgi:hypothetical protein
MSEAGVESEGWLGFFFFDKRKKHPALVGTRATVPKTATKSTKSPNADMPPEAWAPDSPVSAAWRATAAEAMRNAKRYPPATIATLRTGFMA